MKTLVAQGEREFVTFKKSTCWFCRESKTACTRENLSGGVCKDCALQISELFEENEKVPGQLP